jgi:hypothetical protein
MKERRLNHCLKEQPEWRNVSDLIVDSSRHMKYFSEQCATKGAKEREKEKGETARLSMFCGKD